MTKFQDPEIEKYILSAFLKGPEFWRDVPEIWFDSLLHQKTYKEYKKFLKPPYSTYPTYNLVTEKAEDVDVKILIKDLEVIEVNIRELGVKIQDLFDMYCSRKIYDMSSKIPDDLEKMKVEDIIKKHISSLSDLMNPFSIGGIHREFIYESAVERWLQYKDIESGNATDTAIPFHIKDLDKATKGGLRKSHIMLIVAPTGGYKSQVMGNIGYNYSFIEKSDTMIATLEIPGSGDQRDYQRLIDARHSLLEFSDIVSGKLNMINRPLYREKLMDIDEQKYPLYIVDIPDKASPADLIREYELYYAKTGKYPSSTVIDYANEMEPVTGYGNTSEKFKNLGVELRRIARTYGSRIITAMQLNREGKKIKEGEKRDLEHVSESQYFANVCHVVAFLYQDANGIDAATNQLHWILRKNRYGKINESFSTFANPAFFYVGDRNVIYAGH